MIWSTPKFWYKNNHFFSFLLWPLSLLYKIITFWITYFKKPKAISIPVICIGNAVSGGAGKTPTVLALINHLQQQGLNPHVVMRGHGGTIKHTHRVKAHHDNAQAVGDEALLMASHVPTWIGCNRYQSAQAAEQQGADLIIMDDGLQNGDMQTDLRLLVVNGQQQFGNNFIFPAGPLRQSVTSLIKTCHGIIIIDAMDDAWYPPVLNKRQKWQAFTRPDQNIIKQLRAQKIYAFCGLGFNEKFFTMLTRLELNVVGTKSYSDHYVYQQHDFDNLYKEAKAQGAQLVTTAKDWQRLRPEWRQEIIQIPIQLHIDDYQTLINMMMKLL